MYEICNNGAGMLPLTEYFFQYFSCRLLYLFFFFFPVLLSVITIRFACCILPSSV